jgi:hypothetical protein
MDLLTNLINEFKSIGNFVCNPLGIYCFFIMSSYFLFIFFIHSFSIVILLVYIKKIFLSVFTDGYCEYIFNQKNSPQSTDENISSMCSFVFVNFLVVPPFPQLSQCSLNSFSLIFFSLSNFLIFLKIHQ